ncbi:SRPBCC family protein [Archangium primigenium]|uniref:SRPBCC family protein n=1 Tax=[Archangium] primigenium TaxID=2792470 RepID=UPI00195E008A|nr:SRPBCC family protein [Archangium primigenium]MBM7113593.1 SRPBCC family protein [Archangium primigenium]
MLKKILISSGGVFGGVLVVGLVLPSTYRVERTTLLRAPTGRVYPHVADPKRWREWTPWQEAAYPEAQWAFGSQAGPGAVRSWSGERVGRGSLVLTRADPETGVAYDVSLDGGRFLAQGTIAFASSEDGTWVTWVDSGDVGGNPFLHYLVPWIEARLGRDLDQALLQLQRVVRDAPAEVVEATPAPEPVPETAPAVAAPVPDAGPAPMEDAGPAPAVDAGHDAGHAPDAGVLPAASEEPAPSGTPTSAESSLPEAAPEDAGPTH